MKGQRGVVRYLDASKGARILHLKTVRAELAAALEAAPAGASRLIIEEQLAAKHGYDSAEEMYEELAFAEEDSNL